MKFIKDLDKEYENCCESFAKGSKEITDAYNAMCSSFEEYLCAIEEHKWKEGFNHAMRLIRKEEETGKKALDTEEKRLRRAIGAILDELNEEKLRETHIFLHFYFGTGGVR